MIRITSLLWLFSASAFGQVASASSCSLSIAAASDLAPLRQKITEQFQQVYSCKLSFSFSSSGQLASQIEQGAPYDIYLSASEDYVRKLSAKRLIESSSITVFARGRLGLWAPKQAAPIQLRQLTESFYKKVAIANPAHAPYGIAAKQALVRAGVWEALADRLVFGENVRQALQFAETGNVDAVITAWSLVKNRPGAQLIDAGLHNEIRQTLGILTSSSNKAAATLFCKWLTNTEAKRLLSEYGFY